jgi:hypothetical protein
MLMQGSLVEPFRPNENSGLKIQSDDLGKSARSTSAPASRTLYQSATSNRFIPETGLPMFSLKL